MDLHQSAHLEWNLYRACDPWPMNQDWKIKRWEAEYVYTHIRDAHLLFRSVEYSHCHQAAQVAFRASMVLVVVEVHLCLYPSNESVDTLLREYGKDDSPLFDFPQPLPCVFLSQPAPCYACETQHPTSSLPELRHVVSALVVACPHLRRAKTLLHPFWPYSRQDASRTVQAVPDLLVLP